MCSKNGCGSGTNAGFVKKSICLLEVDIGHCTTPFRRAVGESRAAGIRIGAAAEGGQAELPHPLLDEIQLALGVLGEGVEVVTPNARARRGTTNPIPGQADSSTPPRPPRSPRRAAGRRTASRPRRVPWRSWRCSRQRVDTMNRDSRRVADRRRRAARASIVRQVPQPCQRVGQSRRRPLPTVRTRRSSRRRSPPAAVRPCWRSSGRRSAAPRRPRRTRSCVVNSSPLAAMSRAGGVEHHAAPARRCAVRDRCTAADRSTARSTQDTGEMLALVMSVTASRRGSPIGARLVHVVVRPDVAHDLPQPGLLIG